MITIVSRDNPRFKRLRKWATQHRARREDGVILLDGLHLIKALLAAGGRLNEIAVSESGASRPEIADWLTAYESREAHDSGRARSIAPGEATDDSGRAVSAAAAAEEVESAESAESAELAELAESAEILHFPDALFAALVETETPSGILAVAVKPTPAGEPARDIDCVLLDGVQDPGNVGALLRTVAAAGVRQALLAPGCADPWAAKTLRAGQGAQFLLDIHEAVDLPAFLGTYAGHGVVTHLDAPTTLWDAPFDGPLAWVFGAEGRGVSAPVAAAATLLLRIPMPGGTESLNVAAAAAICLFERVRRRRT